MRTADLSISLGGNVPLFVLFTLLFALAAFLFYRYTLPPLPSRLRFILSSLRGLALVILLFMTFEPILRLTSRRVEDPQVAVLVDVSQSMTIRDASGDRAKNVREALAGGILNRLPGGVTAKLIPFSAKILSTGAGSLDSLAFNGEITNFSETFAGTKELLLRENIRCAILITDGNYTAGKNPLYEGEALGIPIFTVGVGDTSNQKDILIDRVLTNALAYTETQVPIDLTVKSSGYGGESVEVSLSEGGAVLDRRTVALQQGVREYPVALHFTPKEEGVRKYTMSVSSLPGELTTKNNTRSMYIKVLKSRLNVLMLAGAPHADVSAIRLVLSEDNHVTLRSLVQRNNGGFYEGSLTRQLVDSADCIVFAGYPSAASGNADVQLLREEILKFNKPLLFVNGRSVDYGKLSQFQDILPFSWSAPGTNEALVGASIPEAGKHHALLQLEGKISWEDWQDLPPIYKSQTSFKAKPEASVLAYAVLRNIVLPEPLVALRSVGREKSFAVTGEGIWRWRLMAQTNPRIAEFFPLLLTNAVRWLSTREDDRRIRIAPAKEVFTSAEPVQFTGQVYDEQLRPVDNAEVTVRIERAPDAFEVVLTSVGNGLYEGAIDGIGEGDFTFTGKAAAGGASLGSDKGKFSVGEVNVEFLETKMNKQLLEQLAYRTGGTYHDLSDVRTIGEEIAAKVTFAPKELVEASEVELWNWKYLGGMLVILFAAEWFLRKRSGML